VVLDAGPEFVSLGASGVVWGVVSVAGKQGHAGYPFLAKNAVSGLLRLGNRLCEFQHVREEKRSVLDAPPDTGVEKVYGRFSITMVSGGEKENIIPGIAQLRFDMRLLPEEEVSGAVSEFQVFFDEAARTLGIQGATFEQTSSLQGYMTSEKHWIAQELIRAAAAAKGVPKSEIPTAGELGGNDGSFVSPRGIPTVCFGPIRSDTNFHGVNEFVWLEDIRLVRDTVINLIKTD